MVEELPPQVGSNGALDRRTLAALRAVLALDADTAADVRERSPSRRRPVPQYGPRLDLGGDRDGDARAADAACTGDDGSGSTAP